MDVNFVQANEQMLNIIELYLKHRPFMTVKEVEIMTRFLDFMSRPKLVEIKVPSDSRGDSSGK